jgi:hypothetical protein
MDTKEAIKTLNEKAGVETKEEENPFKKLHYATQHLQHFHEFNSLIGLYGRHYIPLIKARWYQLHGGILQKVVKLGNLRTDTRVHVAYPLPTEAGKNEIIYSIKRLIDIGIEKNQIENFSMSEPISYSPESLVGKFIEVVEDNPAGKPKKIKVKKENRGHFDNDFLEFDECNSLITSNSPEVQQAREYLSKSENPIGQNRVEKRLVDNTKEEIVAYCPSNTDSYYFQPYGRIPESFVLQGFGRRKIIPVGNVTLFLNRASEKTFEDKLADTDYSEHNYQEKLIQHLEIMRKKLERTNFTFTEDARKLIQDYALYLSEQGVIHSDKIANYSKVIKYSTLANLVKFSCIIAGSNYSYVVDENCVSLAYMDLVELLQNTFDFVYDKIEGEFDYGARWKGADYKQAKCLKYLYNHEALNQLSSEISIDQFLEEAVMPTFLVQKDGARKKYLEMKKSKLIDSKQTDKNETRVWLNFDPKMHQEMIKGCKGRKGWGVYNSVFLSLNSISATLQPLQPLQPYENKINPKPQK